MIPEKQSPEITEIKGILENITNQINEKVKTVNKANKKFKLMKAIYEHEYNLIYMSLKAKYPDNTQGDLDAEAEIGAYKKRLKMIIAEADYKKYKAEVSYLRDQYDNALEDSRNLRAEIKRFNP